jgi:hypothetical protein
MRALVYPCPDDSLLPMPRPRPDTGEAVSVGTGTDDFFGLRDYQPSETLFPAYHLPTRREQAIEKFRAALENIDHAI